jgi:hypothetical protein
MDLNELVSALLAGEALAARQWVADAGRCGLVWKDLPRPDALDAAGMAVAAGVVETLAQRARQAPPAWTGDVGAAPTVVCLVRAAESMPRLRRLCETEGPEPLRRRRVLAPPGFLTAA